MRRIAQLLTVVIALVVATVAPSGLVSAAPQRPEAPAQVPPTPTVKVYGKSGTFGNLASISTMASGQSIATQAVPNWSFPAGREFWANALTADGSILAAGGDQNACQPCQTSAESAISAFNPTTNAYTVTKLKTTMFDAGGNPIPASWPHRRRGW
jgi:hypothetical protein